MKKEIIEFNLNNKNYPYLLKETENAPKTLFVRGALPLQDDICVAIVGTRKATSNGRLIAKKIASELVEAGVVVVSGLALGIDTAAHEGAISGGGKTIAVLGNGLNQIYPASNENLARRIIESGGGLISEYSPEIPSYPSNFLERNRIISGLSVATIVVEAPARSGSLATARNALEQNREIFVVPGPANHLNYQGSHQLIRDGARLAVSGKEILEDLGISIKKKINDLATIKSLTKEEKSVFDIIKSSSRPLSVDKIAELCNIEVRLINQYLSFLMIKGLIKESNRGYLCV